MLIWNITVSDSWSVIIDVRMSIRQEDALACTVTVTGWYGRRHPMHCDHFLVYSATLASNPDTVGNGLTSNHHTAGSYRVSHQVWIHLTLKWCHRHEGLQEVGKLMHYRSQCSASLPTEVARAPRTSQDMAVIIKSLPQPLTAPQSSSHCSVLYHHLILGKSTLLTHQKLQMVITNCS
jgi:hypothetical protein